MDKARDLLIAKEYVRAMSAYQAIYETLSQEQKSIAALNMAICAINLHDHQNALKLLDQSISLEPTYWKAYYRKAQLLISMRRFAEASEIILQLKNKQPCPEVDQLQEQFKQAYSDLDYLIQELQEASTDRDIQRVFQQFYSNTHCDVVNRYGLTLLNLNVYHSLKLINHLADQLPQNIQHWIMNFNYQTDHPKKFEIQQIYMSLLSRCQIDQAFTEKLQTDFEFYFDRNLLLTFKMFVHNPNLIVSQEFLESIARQLSKSNDFDQDSQQFQMIMDLLIRFMKQKQYYFGFLNRDTYRRQDIILLIAYAISKSLPDRHDKYLSSLLAKPQKNTKLKIEFLMIALKTCNFQITNCEEHSQQLMELLKDKCHVDVMTLLITILSQQKYTHVYECLFQFDLDYYIREENLILLSFLAKFDDAKLLIQNLNFDAIFQTLTIVPGSVFQNIRVYQSHIQVFQLCTEMCTDKGMEFKNEQKERYNMDDETFEQATQLQKQYGGTDESKFLKYTEKNIHSLRPRLVKILSHLNNFLKVFESNLEENTIELILKLISRLVDDRIVDYALQPRVLRFAALHKDLEFLPKVMKFANPQLFDFKDSQLMTNALIYCVEMCHHEMMIFYSLLGLVQLSTLETSYPILRKNVIILQNQLLEKNNYIVHASLQIFNNLCLSIDFLNDIQEQKYNKLIEILIAVHDAQLARSYNANEKDFSHPIQVQNTLISLFTQLCQCPYFRSQYKLDISKYQPSEKVEILLKYYNSA